MRQIICLTLACLAALPAQAASFDCLKARTSTEKMICADPELSKLDEDMAAAYRQALARPDVKQGIAKSQRQWLKLERDACPDTTCLKQSYRKRISELQLGSSFGITMMRLAPGEKPPTPALRTPAPPPPKPAPMAVPHPKPSIHPAVCDAVLGNPNVSGNDDLEYLDGSVDMTIAGKKATVYITQEGSAHVDYLRIEGPDGELIDEEEGPDDADLALARFAGKIYVISSNQTKLTDVSVLDEDGGETQVCQFGSDKTPTETIAKSHDDKLCKLGLQGKLDYVLFDQPNSLSAGTVDSDPNGALVDINNDGSPDFVFKSRVIIPGTGGCMGTILGAANKTHDAVDWSITDKLPQPECDSEDPRPLTYRGQAYIEVRYYDPLILSNVHRIVQLKHGKLSTICDYDVSFRQYVMGDYERIIAAAKAAYKDPWDYALEQPGTDALQTLIDAGQDPRIAPGQGAFGTVLHEAIRLKRYDALSFLLDHGVDPNLRATYPLNQTPLIFAVSLDRIEAVKLLMAHGADPNLTTDGQTALQCVDFAVQSEAERDEMRRLLTRH